MGQYRFLSAQRGTRGHIVSKTDFMNAHRCEKAYYLRRHEARRSRELREMIRSESTQSNTTKTNSIRWGNDVGRFAAQTLFPNGEDVSASDLRFDRRVRATRELMASSNGPHIIYEASFEHEGSRVAADVLVRTSPTSWRLVEIKCTTRKKPNHVVDAAMQTYVIRQCGVDLDSTSLVHLNRDFTLLSDEKKASVSSHLSHISSSDADMFTEIDITDDVNDLRPEIERRLNAVRSLQDVPDVAIGSHCTAPHTCTFRDYCWKHVDERVGDEPSVFTLAHAGQKRWDLMRRSILKQSDIPSDVSLTRAQRIQVDANRTGQWYVERDKLASFLDTVTFPTYFFDVETVAMPVPRWIGTSPYEAVPFQFSLHYQVAPADVDDVDHVEYLAETDDPHHHVAYRNRVPEDDPRPEFVRRFLDATERPGDIWTYNVSFERRVLSQLKLFCETRCDHDLAEGLQSRIDRLRDLMVPFQKKWCYAPSMDGRYSVKKVLPALVPDMSYETLLRGGVQNGEDACNTFEAMLLGLNDGLNSGEIDESSAGYMDAARSSLLSYCELDTLAMVRILRALQEINEDALFASPRC